MKLDRLAIVGLALATAIGVAGCGSNSDNDNDTGNTGNTGGGNTAAAPATTKAGTPVEELTAASEKLLAEPTKLKMSSAGGVTMEGATDAGGKRVDMTMKLGANGSMQIRRVDSDMYLKFSGAMAKNLGAGAKWMHVDAAKMSPESSFSLEKNDPRSQAKLLATSSEVTKTGDRSYRGFIDMTKSPALTPQMSQALGDKMKRVPFEAETDDQGRLTRLSIDMESLMTGAGETEAIYYDFGVPVTVEAPAAAEVVEMPAKMLKAMGG